MRKLFPVLFLPALLALSGCSGTAPECPSAQPGPEVRSAGCLVIHENKLLVIRELTGKISIPGGSGDTGETGRCTAFRETWEETGLSVTPTELIRRFDNGFHLYRCALTGNSAPAPEFTHEVQEALWLNSTDFDQYRWRFPDQKVWLKDLLQSD